MPKASLRICAFDLETTGLSAAFSAIMCAVLKEPGKDPTVLRIDECSADWQANPQDDHRLVDQLARRLEAYDAWVVFNGTAFDIPFLRRRLAHWGLAPLADRTVIDPCLIARRELHLSKNSLAALASRLGLGRKYSVPFPVWIRATTQADREALDAVVQHCANDVALLERLIAHLITYCPQLNPWKSS